MLAGISLVMLYSLAFGGYHYDPLDGNYSFVGAFSSKNQLGFFCLARHLFRVCLHLHPARARPGDALPSPAPALSGYALVASQSATSIIATAARWRVMAGLGARSPVRAAHAERPSSRPASCLRCASSSSRFNFGGLNLLLGAFGKDATLTGRPILVEGLAAAWQSPVFGVGYQAYWVQGFPKPSGSGTNSTSPRAAASISTTPISKCWWNSASSALCWPAWCCSGSQSAICAGF